jgi:hypothetical protein
MQEFLDKMKNILDAQCVKLGLQPGHPALLVMDNAPSHNGESLFEPVAEPGFVQSKYLFRSVAHPSIYMWATIPGRSHVQNSGMPWI